MMVLTPRYVLLWMLLSALLFSCLDTDPPLSTDPSIQLVYSEDTIFFDTVFTQRRTIDKRLVVVNPSNKSISVENLTVSNNAASYTFVVNGKTNATTDVLLRGGDSILILISAQFDFKDEDFPRKFEDELLLEYNGRADRIILQSFHQDANVLSSFVVDRDTTLQGPRPYLVTDSLIILEGATLTVQDSVTFFFDSEAYIEVRGTLSCLANPLAPIRFTDSRGDDAFDKAYGYWSGIFGTTDEAFVHLRGVELTNSRFGVFMTTETPDPGLDALIEQSRFLYFSQAGIAAWNAEIKVDNTLIANTLRFCLAIQESGTLDLNHVTATAYGFDNRSNVESGVINIFNQDTLENPLPATLVMRNSIIWGNEDSELAIQNDDPEVFTLAGSNNIIRIDLSEAPDEIDAFFGSEEQKEGPFFANPRLDLWYPDSASKLINQGTLSELAVDLENSSRDSLPDIGAYEYQPDRLFTTD